jgi:hypothetical protein
MIDDPKRDEARRERAERAFKRREEGAQAMTDYEAEGHAVRAKTARLKAQREERADKKAVIVPIKPRVAGDRPLRSEASRPRRWRVMKLTALATGRQPMSSGQAASAAYSRGRRNFATFAMKMRGEDSSTSTRARYLSSRRRGGIARPTLASR